MRDSKSSGKRPVEEVESVRPRKAKLECLRPDATERKKAEEALQRSKQEWENTFNAISDWVVMVDLKGRILRTNRVGEKFTGVPLDEIIGQSCCKLVHGSEKHIPGCPLLKMLETGQRASAELQVPGTDSWVMVTTDPVTDEEGNLIGAVHITRDITERKRAEGELEAQRNKLQATMAVIESGITIQDREYNIIYQNRYLEERFGGLGEKCYRVYEGREGVCEGCPVEKAFRDGKFHVAERKIVMPNGEIGYWDNTASPIRDAAGEIVSCVELARDITERKRVEEALQKSEERYRMLAERMNDGLGLLDENGRYTYVNNKYGEMLGYSPDEMVGRHWTNFFDEDAQKTIKEQLIERKKSTAKPYEIVTTRRDGKKIFIRISPQAIFDADGKFRGSFGLLTDITERKRAEKEIRRLAKFPSENPYPVVRIAADGTILYANPVSDTLLAERKSGAGQLCPKQWRNMVDEVLKTGLIKRIEVSHKERTFAFRIVPVQEANYVNFYGVDITERKKAETKLFEYQAQLKSLASELTLVEEHERRRIATELHDTIGQSLVISKIKLDALRTSAPSADIAGTLGEVCELLDQTIQEAGALTFDLSSPILYELGFEPAVASWLTEEIEEKHGIATELEKDKQPKPLDDDVCVLLFRDVRELFTNVVRHARAKKIKVSICRVGGEIHVSVEDDGVGFDPAEIRATAVRKGGFGLFSIRERLEQLGGHLELESAPGQGTKATLIAPLKREKINKGEKR